MKNGIPKSDQSGLGIFFCAKEGLGEKEEGMKKGLIVFNTLLLATLGMGFTSVAVAGSPENEAYNMGAVVVTATRYEESISTVPANVTVISQKDIESATARDIPDMLRTVAGIHVNDIGGNQRKYTVDLRGFGETAGLNTLVLVDGRRTNQADLSGTDWSQLPLDQVAKLEIIRGGRASILYGDNAAGGVINIITKKGEGVKAGAQMAGGSYDTYKGNAIISGSEKHFSYALSGSYLESEGYRDNSDTEAKDFGMNLGYELGKSGAVNLSYGYHKDNSSLPGALKASDFAAGARRTDTVQPKDFADTEDYYVKAGPEFYFLTDSMVKCDVSYRKRDVTNFASGDWGSFEGGFDIETISVSPQMVVGEKIFARGNTLILGFDYSRAEEDITNTSEFFGSVSTALVGMEKKNYGYYIHDEFMLLPKLGLSAGYRYDSGKFEFDSSLPISGADQVKFDEELYTVGVNYQFTPKSNVYTSISRSFRFPVLDELFNFYTNSIISGLKPQTSNDVEIGLRHFFTDTLRAGINFFRIDTEDEIFYNLDSYGNENMDGDTHRQGIEVSLEKGVKWGSIALAYTYTHAEVDGGVFDNSDMPDVPEHQASVKTVVEIWKPFTMALNGTYMGKRPFISDFSNSFRDQKDYFVVNAKLKYQWKRVSAFLDINNLLNENYSEYGVLGGYPTERAYYPSPRTNFMIGISLEL
jgi:iron complex outermembrane recepter protein